MIRDRIPKKNIGREGKAVQGFIPESLKSLVEERMARDRDMGLDVNWSTLLQACLEAYLEEQKDQDEENRQMEEYYEVDK